MSGLKLELRLAMVTSRDTFRVRFKTRFKTDFALESGRDSLLLVLGSGAFVLAQE